MKMRAMERLYELWNLPASAVERSQGAIHRKGGSQIMEECRLIRSSLPDGLPTGGAVATTGGRLRAKNVVHTVGPVWSGGNNGESELLALAYKNCLVLALKMGIKTISFPSISTGLMAIYKGKLDTQ
jgi:O-acetyl-ADP-ribose deacetylase (regulator of RNase III)